MLIGLWVWKETQELPKCFSKTGSPCFTRFYTFITTSISFNDLFLTTLTIWTSKRPVRMNLCHNFLNRNWWCCWDLFLLKRKATLFWPKATDLVGPRRALGKTLLKAADFLVSSSSPVQSTLPSCFRLAATLSTLEPTLVTQPCHLLLLQEVLLKESHTLREKQS